MQDSACKNSPISAETTAKVAPRAEFRVFGHGLIERVKARMWNGRTVLHHAREMPTETYFLSRRTSAVNVKVRDDLLDVKVKIGETPEGYEIFQPRGKYPLPVGPAELATILSYLEVSATVEQQPYSLDDLVALARRHSDLAPVRVDKMRYGFTIEDVICEYAEVYFNGALLESACVESENYAAMRTVIDGLGLTALPNVNYLRAAKGVVGME